MSAARAKGTVARNCERCGGQRTGTKYCAACGKLVARERGMHPERRKPCPSCGGAKEPGKRRYCVACSAARQPLVVQAERDRARYKSRLQREARGVQPRAPKVDAAGNVRCSTCLEYLPPSQFRTRQGSTTAYGSQCRSCYSTYLHERRLETMFGLSLEDYDRLFAQQDGRCAICTHRPRTRRLAVDHDHKTGEVRGLLCTRCNHKVLGGAGESASLLRRAARYLELPPARSGLPIEALGDIEEQGTAGFFEAAEHLLDGEVVEWRGIYAVTGRTFVALSQAAGFALVVDGVRIEPNPQMAIDDMELLEQVRANTALLMDPERTP